MHCRDTLTGKHHVQLSEWWADFDERVMRPVFNKPDTMEEWTPRGEGARMLFMQAIQTLAFILLKSLRRVVAVCPHPLALARIDCQQAHIGYAC